MSVLPAARSILDPQPSGVGIRRAATELAALLPATLGNYGLLLDTAVAFAAFMAGEDDGSRAVDIRLRREMLHMLCGRALPNTRADQIIAAARALGKFVNGGVEAIPAATMAESFNQGGGDE